MKKSYQEFYNKDPKEFTKEDAKMLVEKPETPGKGRGEHFFIVLKYVHENKVEDGLKKFLK